MNETLMGMGLLFRLEDFGVRVFHKSVTKKVIMLRRDWTKLCLPLLLNKRRKIERSQIWLKEIICTQLNRKLTTKAEDILIPDSEAVGCNSANKFENNSCDGDEAENEAAVEKEETEKLDDGTYNGGEGGEAIVETEEIEKLDDVEAEENEEVEKPDEANEIVAAVDEKKVLIEKMIEKNELLIKMMKKLCEKNKLQTQMLSKSVESLEKK